MNNKTNTVDKDNTTVINLKAFFQLLKKYSKFIIATSILGIVVAWLSAVVIITPKYGSSADILVNRKTNDIQTQLNVQQADLQAINTYKDILKKPIILGDVLKTLKEKDNYSGNLEDLQNSLVITNETNSQVITVSAITENPYIARDMANIVSEVFTKKIKKIMQVDNVTVVSTAKVNTTPVSPNKKVMIMIGFLVGLGVGIAICGIKELLNTKVDSTSYLTDDLGLTNLGVVYHIENGKRSIKAVTIVDDKLATSVERRI
ncbi:chain-length determining protein [Ligilactobacillus murinus]|uniref:YveK family protein n=1 Tax=Ligilactobacillus murinus TaxID=1622 RepID=UPI001C8B8069|nr:Wzz/FepE/Etk N-terminal domain-containing protein [Ligilactobacillus murinus]MBX9012749.1 chain-length determining protein [Ligilactobacillus murinus]